MNDTRTFLLSYAVIVFLFAGAAIQTIQLSGAFLSAQACAQAGGADASICERYRVFGSLLLFAVVAYPLVYGGVVYVDEE